MNPSHTNRIPDPLLSRALAAWREANPEGLIGRLVALHRRDPQKARTLAFYIETYYMRRTPSGRWPYQWLMADVAAWPQPQPQTDQPCPSCSGSGRWADDILCGHCEGRGVV